MDGYTGCECMSLSVLLMSESLAVEKELSVDPRNERCAQKRQVLIRKSTSDIYWDRKLKIDVPIFLISADVTARMLGQMGTSLSA
jgi:hypothetical protein